MNRSFNEVCEILQKNGVKDASFLTSTINPNVIGLDPYSTDLTSEQKMMIIQECKNNIWYFFREVLRIQSLDKKSYVPFDLNVGTAAFVFLYNNEINGWLRLSRQSYSTGTMVACSVWDETFNGKDIILLHPKDHICNKELQIKKDVCTRSLPNYIRNYNSPKNHEKIIFVDDAELLKYDEFRWCKKISDRTYFSSVVIKKADPKLIKKVDGFKPFSFDMYNKLPKDRNILISYPPTMTHSAEWTERMKHILFDKDSYDMEILLKRID